MHSLKLHPRELCFHLGTECTLIDLRVAEQYRIESVSREMIMINDRIRASWTKKEYTHCAKRRVVLTSELAFATEPPVDFLARPYL